MQERGLGVGLTAGQRGHEARHPERGDADEALARLGQDVPDLLLCDIALPGEDGCSLLRKVRSRGGKLGAVPAAEPAADFCHCLLVTVKVVLTPPTSIAATVPITPG